MSMNFWFSVRRRMSRRGRRAFEARVRSRVTLAAIPAPFIRHGWPCVHVALREEATGGLLVSFPSHPRVFQPSEPHHSIQTNYIWSCDTPHAASTCRMQRWVADKNGNSPIHGYPVGTQAGGRPFRLEFGN